MIETGVRADVSVFAVAKEMGAVTAGCGVKYAERSAAVEIIQFQPAKLKLCISKNNF